MNLVSEFSVDLISEFIFRVCIMAKHIKHRSKNQQSKAILVFK